MLLGDLAEAKSKMKVIVHLNPLISAQMVSFARGCGHGSHRASIDAGQASARY